MANKTPDKPNLKCDVPLPEENGYYTDNQSMVNTARSDKFILVLDLPCTLKDIIKTEKRSCHGGDLDRLTMNIWGYVVPEISVPKLEQSWGGQAMNFSTLSRPSYPTVSVNFTVDNKFDNYYILWRWLNLMNDSKTGNSVGHASDYMAEISVIVEDEYEIPIAKFTYHNAFPTGIGAINTGSREGKEIETDFSFDFSQFEMELL